MNRVVLISLILLAAAVQVARPEAELVLRDGRIIRGAEVRRQGDLYVITLESGEKLSFPVELADEVRLGEEDPALAPPPGIRSGDPETLGGALPQESAPSGLRRGEPQTLAGSEVRPPRPSEQTHALGPPAGFQRGVVDSRWIPKSDWDIDPARNDFNPSTWSRPPIDPEWKPRSAFAGGNDVLESGRSRWQESIVDPGWQPSDAFGGRSAF